ncbi:MAG TPA: DUF1800 domain-containing protein, partial [Rhodocyclaceae bacterium]|nr:DUF1800 domain-containing protein [Rhodocyclaceae bacterium]
MRAWLPREFLKYLYAALFLGLFANAYAFSNPKEAPGMGVADARHFLARVGFGATPEEIDAFAKLSHAQAIAQVLKPIGTTVVVPAPPDVAEFVPRSAIREQRAQSEDAKKAVQQEQVRRALLLRAWWVDNLLQTPDPATELRERMVLFWHNHFVSSVSKVKSAAVMQRQNQLFRERGLGSFADLLHAVAKDPAMVVYLDSASNRKGSPNENFAREVMELFTLGEGHYSEQDIKEAARAYTGWSVDPETGLFKWRPMAHDFGEKNVLGQSGNFDGDAVLDILLSQPQCAEFIVEKLWREFISPQPDSREVKRIARAWYNAGRTNGVPSYDLRFVLAELFKSKAFW